MSIKYLFILVFVCFFCNTYKLIKIFKHELKKTNCSNANLKEKII